MPTGGIFAKAVGFFLRNGAAKDGAAVAGKKSLPSRLFGSTRKDVPLASRVVTRDPIDVASGEVILHRRDVDLKGVLPLVLERTHVSTHRDGGLYGPSWASTVDQHLRVDAEGVRYTAADGMVLTYPPTPTGATSRPATGPNWPLEGTRDGGYTVEDPRTLTRMRFGRDGSRRPLASITDRNGNRIDLAYDATGSLHGITHSGGHRIAVDTVRGRISALRLLTGDGREEALVGYGHDDAGNLVEVSNSSGTGQRYTYDDEHRLTGWRDGNGHWYRYTYDEHGRAVRGAGANGALDTTVTYDPAGAWTTVTDSCGGTTTYRFDERRRVIAQTDPLGHTTTFGWDAADRLRSRTDPLGHTVRYSYDERGDLRSLTRPDGRESRADYDALGLPTRVVEADGAVWRNERDPSGNVTAVIDPLGNVTRYGYDDHGAVTSIVGPLGETTTVRVNAAGLPLAVTDPAGGTTSYGYDARGRVATITDAVGGTTHVAWTPEGWPISRTPPDGHPERWEYDPEGNVVAHTDGSGRVTRTEYGPFGVPTARIGPDGTRLEFRHDTELRLVRVLDQQGLTWRYSYDAAGNPLSETDFDGRVVDYGHDAAGRLVSRAYAGEPPATYLRDPLGNVVAKRTGDRLATFAYDDAGRLIGATDPDADVRFERDLLGRVTAETSDGRTLTFGYDAAGSRVRRTTPSGAVSGWDYDAAGRPSALSFAGRRIAFEHDAAGREIRRRIGPDVLLDQRWDARHRLVSQALWRTSGVAGEYALAQYRSYTRGPADEVVAMEDQLSGPRRFELDRGGRVTAVHARGWTERYAYDAAGEIVHARASAGAEAADATRSLGDRQYRGRRLWRAGNTFYEYDHRGRVVSRRTRTLSGQDRTWSYAWDADDRLVAVTAPGARHWRYRYDALGRRVAKLRVDPAGTILDRVDFTWDGDRLVEQRHRVSSRETRVTTWEYRPGGFEPVAQHRRDVLADAPQDWIDRRFDAIIADAVGAAAELLDLAGNLTWHRATTLFGRRLQERPEHAAEETACPLRFPGQYHDAETGLDYNRYRYYEADTGRYLSGDPIGLAGGLRPYGYVRNPLTQIDPLGLTQELPPGMVRIFRTTGRAEENDVYRRTGYIMSDAAQDGYKHGAGLESAMARSREVHDVNVSGLGSEHEYAWAHQGGATGMMPAHARSLISFTTNEASARRAAALDGSSFFSAVVDPKTILLTTHGGTEGEVLVRHMIRVEPWK